MAEFTTLRKAVTIKQVCEMLDIKLDKEDRCSPCPICADSTRRIFKVFVDTNTYYCWAHKKSGDIVGLVAEVKKIDHPAAGRMIEQHFGISAPRTPPQAQGFTPDKAAEWGKSLNPSHEALQPLDIHAKTFSAFGAGYNATKPALKDLLCVPCRDAGGTLLGFIGISPETSAITYPSRFTPPPIFNADKVGPGTLTVVFHPLDVLRQLDSGIEELGNVVAILSPLTPDLLDDLSALGRERGVTDFDVHP